MTNDFSKYEKYLSIIKNTDKEDIIGLFSNKDDYEILNSIFSTVRLSHNESSFKLTSTGHYVLSKLLECYKCEIQENDILKGKSLIDFDQIVNVPWKIQGKILYVFDEEMAFNFKLVETFERFIGLYK